MKANVEVGVTFKRGDNYFKATVKVDDLPIRTYIENEVETYNEKELKDEIEKLRKICRQQMFAELKTLLDNVK